MKRRTLKRHQWEREAALHYNVYVVRLDPGVASLRRVQNLNPNRDSAKPCVYVGMTGLGLEERFQNHKNGIKASYYVKRFGKEFLPELYEHLNPMPYAQACVMERELAEDLRNEGYTVTGGH